MSDAHTGSKRLALPGDDAPSPKRPKGSPEAAAAVAATVAVPIPAVDVPENPSSEHHALLAQAHAYQQQRLQLQAQYEEAQAMGLHGVTMTTIASAHESRSAPAVIADEPGEAQGRVTGRVGDSVPVVEPIQAADPHSAAAAAVPDSTATDDAGVGSEHGDATQRLSKKGWNPRRGIMALSWYLAVACFDLKSIGGGEGDAVAAATATDEPSAQTPAEVDSASATAPVDSLVSHVFGTDAPDLTTAEVVDLFSYAVPVLAPDGKSCSYPQRMDPVPFDLFLEAYSDGTQGPIANNASRFKIHPFSWRLWRLRMLVQRLQAEVGMDWVGIYRRVETRSPPGGNDGPTDSLVKEAYVGAPSRPIFPLVGDWAEVSNNAWVALEGKVRLIADVATHAGPYYVCDGKVNSELCAPIFSADGDMVVGIIDAESFEPNFFTRERAAAVLQVCADLSQLGFLPVS